MANQKSKIIDVTQSYIPVDPQAFPETLGLTQKEDDPAKDMTILAYEGYNFLPTSYGYRAYFGTSTLISFDALTTPCDKILSFQSKTYENTLLAFCSDGVYMVKAGETAWTKIWALTDTWTVSQIYSQYTWTVIENTLYIYRQGAANVLKVLDDLTYTLITPSFLNMTGQMGIFKANGSLAFWDSENSIAWSNVFDLIDFTPSVENQVGNTIFFGVQGRIVHVQDHGDGFVIYATKSIVGVTYSQTSTAVWDAGVVTSESGIAHPGAITVGTTNQEHFVYTSTGIMKIGHYNALSRKFDSAPILPELFDYLRESRLPVYLACHAARFLYFSLVDADYISGRTSFTDVAVPSLQIPLITVTDTTFTDFDNAGFPLTGAEQFNILDSWLRNPGEGLRTDYTATVYDLPKWVAVAELGIVESTAVDLAGFNDPIDNGDGTFNTYVYPVDQYPLAPATMQDLLDTVAIYDNVYVPSLFPGAPVKNTALALKLIRDNLHTNPIDPTNVTRQAAYSDLTPDKAWQAIYNFFETMDEEVKLADEMIAQALVTVAALNNRVLNWTLVTSSAPSADFTTPADITLLKKSMQVEATLVPDGGLGVAPRLNIVTAYNQGKLITFAGSSRNIGSTTVVPNNPNAGGATAYVIGVGANYRIKTNSPLNLSTLFIYLEGKQPYTLGTTCYVSPNELLQDPIIVMDSGYEMPKLRMFYLNGTMHSEQNLIGYKRTAPLSSSYNRGYTFARSTNTDSRLGNESFYFDLTANGGGPVANSTHFDPNPLYAALLVWEKHKAIYWPDPSGLASVMSQIITNKTILAGAGPWIETNGTLIETVANIRDLRDFYYDASENAIGATFEWDYLSHYDASITPVYVYGVTVTKLLWRVIEDDSGYTYNVASDAPPPGVPEYLYYTPVTDTIKCTAVDVVLDAGQLSLSTHAMSLTMYESNEYTKQVDGSYLNTATTAKFLPLITDTGNTEADPIDYTDTYYYDWANSMIASSQDCTKWTLTKGAINLLGTDFMSHTDATMLGVPFGDLGPVADLAELPPCYDNTGAGGALVVTSPSTFTFPSGSYTIQDGVPIPGYPTKKGALVFDLQLKRWGKYKGDHKALVEYAPINSVQNAVIPYTNFGMDSGILDSAGTIKVFSASTIDSYIRYGKIGYYRFGISRLLEVHLHFRTRSTGKIVLDASLEGRSPDTYLQSEEVFTDTLEHIMYCDINAKWFTISIHGQYDLQYAEFRGNMTSRR